MTLTFRNTTAILILLAISGGKAAAEDTELGKGSTAHFASKSEAAEILGRPDDFILRLSEFDRAARMKTDRSVSEREFLEFVKTNVSDWSDEERAKIEAAISRIRPALEALSLSLPKTVLFIKTSGAEEGKAYYTRDTAVVFPESQLSEATAKQIERTIAHELFHIISRQNPELREALYRAIGFTECAEVEFPPELRRRKITNPDAPRNNHSIQIRWNGEKLAAVPILFSNSEKYDLGRGGDFFDYLQLGFIVVTKGNRAVSAGTIIPLEKVSGFFEQVGRNTDYIIHPEEILAENFALLVLAEGNLASPEIVLQMRKILAEQGRGTLKPRR